MASRLALPACLAAPAGLCWLAFAAAHLLGWRPCVGALSGTPVPACASMGIPLGLPYAAGWFAASLAAPPLLIAAALALAWETLPARLKRAGLEAARACAARAVSSAGPVFWLAAAALSAVVVLAGTLLLGLGLLAGLFPGFPPSPLPPEEERRVWCAEKAEALIRAAEEHQAALGAPARTLPDLVGRFIPALPPGGQLPGGCGEPRYEPDFSPPAPHFTVSMDYFGRSMVYDSRPGHPCPERTLRRDKRGWCAVKTGR